MAQGNKLLLQKMQRPCLLINKGLQTEPKELWSVTGQTWPRIGLETAFSPDFEKEGKGLKFTLKSELFF